MKMQLTLQTHNVRDVRSLPTSFLQIEPDLSRLHQLTEADRTEVLEFLSIRPVHTVVMASFIADNGIEGSLNRGKFYGYRGTDGSLEGVALIGHSTLVEARTENALTAHIIVADTLDLKGIEAIKKEVKHALEHLNIQHATLEIESETAHCAAEDC